MKRLSFFITLLAVISLACNAGQSQPTAQTQPADTVTQPTVQSEAVLPSNEFHSSKLGTVERDITYCTMDGVALKMDVYYPSENNGRFPVTMYVHGGGLTLRVKVDQQHPSAFLCQAVSQGDSGGRLAHPAFLIGNADNFCWHELVSFKKSDV